ncbi:MAG: terminase small subunit [Oligoflexia bacterium]|nr:terminase small subunit [Oligoflexia bacterium]
MGFDLSQKQKTFIESYLISGNATRSAIEAGYSAKSAYKTGSRLLKNVQIPSNSSLKNFSSSFVLKYATGVL